MDTYSYHKSPSCPMSCFYEMSRESIKIKRIKSKEVVISSNK